MCSRHFLSIFQAWRSSNWGRKWVPGEQEMGRSGEGWAKQKRQMAREWTGKELIHFCPTTPPGSYLFALACSFILFVSFWVNICYVLYSFLFSVSFFFNYYFISMQNGKWPYLSLLIVSFVGNGKEKSQRKTSFWYVRKKKTMNAAT